MGFLDLIASFPTVIWTVLLGVVLLFWSLVILAGLDIDLFGLAGDGGAEVDGDAGFLGETLCFGTIPLTIIVTFVALKGFLISLAIHALLGPVAATFLFGIPFIILAFVVSLVLAVVLSRFTLRPLRPAFAHHTEHGQHHLIGRAVIITSSTVNKTFGTALYRSPESSGTELLLNVIAADDNGLARDSEAVIVDYDPEHNVYTVRALDLPGIGDSQAASDLPT